MHNKIKEFLPFYTMTHSNPLKKITQSWKRCATAKAICSGTTPRNPTPTLTGPFPMPYFQGEGGQPRVQGIQSGHHDTKSVLLQDGFLQQKPLKRMRIIGRDYNSSSWQLWFWRKLGSRPTKPIPLSQLSPLQRNSLYLS